MAAMRNDTKEGNNMVTVKQVEELGIEIKPHDMVTIRDEIPQRKPIGLGWLINYGIMSTINKDKWLVTEFAPRKNEGVQPVADGVLVDVVFRDGSSKNCVRARDRYWSIDNDSSDIVTWKPSMKNWEQNMDNRLEAAYELYCESLIGEDEETESFDEFKAFKNRLRQWLRIVDKTGYSLEVKSTREGE